MPSAVTPQRRGREDDSNDDGPTNHSTYLEGSRSNKRSRLNINGDASPSGGSLLPDGYLSQKNGPGATDYQPGSIVRVKLDNFVTYTAVEFFPGPSLNMVIGPNGTGKSTLVCAICLGLGWGPQHLGRAKEVSEFVKHGAQDATIEVELAGLPHKKNPVIRCNIKREGNKSHYYINGVAKNRKQVVELAKSFSIQIDNLCQFLPQDKVVEFAAMTPIELLRSTQRAVASQEMLDWHELLIDLRSKQREVQAQSASDIETLANLEKRQSMQAADVDRMRERDQIKERVRMLKTAKPFAQYRDARKVHQEAKEKRRQAAAELEELEREVEPTLRAVNAKQAYRDRVKKVVDERTLGVKTAVRTADDCIKKINQIQERIEELENDKKGEKKEINLSKGDFARVEGIITRLRKQLEEKPGNFDVAAFNELIREKGRESQRIYDNAMELQASLRKLDGEGAERIRRIDQAQEDLKNLESQSGQQNRKLKQINSDCARAWEWIQLNQDQFEKHVYGPPIVECSIKDPRYVDVVEALFSKADFTAFTVQTKADYKKLAHQLHQNMRLFAITIRTMTGTLGNFRPPINNEELSQYGLDGWALDYVNGPEPVLAMLCYEGPRLQSNAVALRDTTNEQYERLQNSPIQTWVTRKSVYRIIRRREYGPGAVSGSVRDTPSAAVWTDQPVDLTAKRELQENIAGWEEEVQAIRRKIQELRVQLAQLKSDRDAVDAAENKLKEEKKTGQERIAAYNALPTRLESQEEKLAELQARRGGARVRLQRLEDKQDTLTLEKGQAALEYANAVEDIRQAHEELYEAELMLIEANSDVAVLTERNSAIKEHLETKQLEVQEIAKTQQRVASDARNILNKCNEFMKSVDPLTKEFLGNRPPNQGLEELENEIDCEEARLELMHEGNGGIIREFEARQQKIDSLKARLGEVNAALEELSAKIKEVRDQWEPQLDKLVKRISDSFAFNMKQINCAGEVNVYKDEDFDQWAVQIQVKFRENEPLTILDSHRQSGGERAVSTIFYLMSLQSLTRSPFRVVDEINQGMDPRNERLVHARMVSIATGNDDQQFQLQEEGVASEDASGEVGDNDKSDGQKGGGGSQYFLITPKLLHGLRYERGMRVLCIASGEYMPKDQACVDFRTSVNIRRAIATAG